MPKFSIKYSVYRYLCLIEFGKNEIDASLSQEAILSSLGATLRHTYTPIIQHFYVYSSALACSSEQLWRKNLIRLNNLLDHSFHIVQGFHC